MSSRCYYLLRRSGTVTNGGALWVRGVSFLCYRGRKSKTNGPYGTCWCSKCLYVWHRPIGIINSFKLQGGGAD